MPGYTLIEIWEHDWDMYVKENKDKMDFFNKNQIVKGINYREALQGGRTNALWLHYCCKENEKIFYYDFTSLYPWVMKYCEFPIGHPTIHTENIDPKFPWFGIMKVLILPPRGLWIPVLCSKINNKLIAALCYTCAIDKNTETPCNHSDLDRALKGTWCTIEINEALKNGYKILKYYEIHHWEKTSLYDEKTKSGGLFASYVNYGLKTKQEASGYPKHCTTPDNIAKYIEDYFLKEGVVLDPKSIEKNSGKREISKIKLNCLWGYFALDSNKTQFKIISDTSELEEYLNNDRYIIHNIDFKDANFIQMAYSEKEEFVSGGLYTNVVIASFVTAHARLKLYSELKKINERVLYFDTDSVFFVHREGEYLPKLGDFLGEFTNEIDPSEGNYITEFVSGGPKNYAYKLDTGITDCTVKGYPINSLTNLLMNFTSIKDCVTDDNSKIIYVPQLKFIKDKSEWQIRTEYQNKVYRFIYDKRIVKDNFKTYPYGY